MKAKVKATGESIEVFPFMDNGRVMYDYDGGYFHCSYSSSELEFLDELTVTEETPHVENELTDFPTKAKAFSKFMEFHNGQGVKSIDSAFNTFYDWFVSEINPPKYIPFTTHDWLIKEADLYVEKIDKQTNKKSYLNARIVARDAKKRDRREILALVSNEEGTVENAVFFDKNGVGGGNSHMRLVLKERR